MLIYDYYARAPRDAQRLMMLFRAMLSFARARARVVDSHYFRMARKRARAARAAMMLTLWLMRIAARATMPMRADARVL